MGLWKNHSTNSMKRDQSCPKIQSHQQCQHCRGAGKFGISALGKGLGLESTPCSFGKLWMCRVTRTGRGTWARSCSQSQESFAGPGLEPEEGTGEPQTPGTGLESLVLDNSGKRSMIKFQFLDPHPAWAAAHSHGIKPEGLPLFHQKCSKTAWDEIQICFIASSPEPKCKALQFQVFQGIGIPSLLLPHRCDCFCNTWRAWKLPVIITIIDPNCSLHFQIPKASLDCIQAQENNDEIQALPYYLSSFFCI